MSKVEFKEFVKRHPELVNFVEKGETNWQRLYELYDLYGENNSVWNKYFSSKNISADNSFKDIVQFIKGIDLNTIQKGLVSLDKAIDAFKEIIPSPKNNMQKPYEPSPNYRYFED